MIRRKLFLVVLLGAIVPLAVLALWLTQRAERAGLELLRADLQQSVHRVSRSVADRWRYRQGDLLLLANNEVVRAAMTSAPDSGALTPTPPYLVQLFASLDLGIRRVTYRDSRSRVRWSLGAESAMVASAGDRANIVASPVVNVSFPIPSDTTAGVLGEMRAEIHLNALLPDTTATGERVLAMYDRRSGSALTRTDLPPIALTQDDYDDRGDRWIVVRDTVPGLPVTLALASPSQAYVAPFRSAARAGLVTVVVIVLVVAWLTIFLTARITRSLLQLSTAAERIRGGDLEQRVHITSTDEIGRVGEAFNAMADNLQQTLAELARRESLAAVGKYAASVSHEVRNALTPIRFDLQRAAETHDDESQRSRLLERAIRNTDRLDQIVSNSLRLARTGSLERTAFDVCGMLRVALQLTMREFDRRGRVVRLEAEEGRVGTYVGNAAALQQLFQNLLLNAAEADGDAVIAVDETDVDLVVTITDSGGGLPVDGWSQDVPLLISSKPEGTGLGLSIARDIAAAHGGAIGFARGVEGTVVTVTLPRGAD